MIFERKINMSEIKWFGDPIKLVFKKVKITSMLTNVFMNQIGGESVRTAILMNPKQVLEFFTNSNTGLVDARIIPVEKYIDEEFIVYGHDMEHVYKVLDSQQLILDNIRDIEVTFADEYTLTATLNGEYTVTIQDDEVIMSH